MTSPDDSVTAPVTAPVTVTVIGAGPAGLATAVTAARAGLTVALVDSGTYFGGQFWRPGPTGRANDPSLHHDLDEFSELADAAEQFIAQGRIRYRPRHHVWSLSAQDRPSGCQVCAVDRADPRRPAETVIDSDYLVIAAGAYDRQLPFPGWDLPGVMTVGAAQSLLKGSGVAVGPRVLVAGSGPFLLPVASTLAARGAKVVGVHEANEPARWLARLPVLVGNPQRLREAGQYLVTLVRHRVPVRNRSMVVAAHGTDRLESVTVARVNRHWGRRSARTRRVAVDVLAIGYGFSAQAELALAAGCRLRVTPDQTLAVVIDDQQATTNPRVFAAGEITGIGGSYLAVAEGRIAGAAVARAAGRPGPPARLAQRDSLRRFATAMHEVYPVQPGWLDNLEADTVVCRCEEVTVAEIDDAIELGARDSRTVKLLSRAGMGWCQGRECGYATACLLAHRTGQPVDLASGAQRPVATPIPLGLVADATTPVS